MCVISGAVSNFPCAISERISPHLLPSTPPVLKVRFLPYISGRGRVWGLSYIATTVTIALGRASFHAVWNVSSPPAASITLSAPPCGKAAQIFSASSGETTLREGKFLRKNSPLPSFFSHKTTFAPIISAQSAQHTPVGPPPRTSTLSPPPISDMSAAQ